MSDLYYCWELNLLDLYKINVLTLYRKSSSKDVTNFWGTQPFCSCALTLFLNGVMWGSYRVTYGSYFNSF